MDLLIISRNYCEYSYKCVHTTTVASDSPPGGCACGEHTYCTVENVYFDMLGRYETGIYLQY